MNYKQWLHIFESVSQYYLQDSDALSFLQSSDYTSTQPSIVLWVHKGGNQVPKRPGYSVSLDNSLDYPVINISTNLASGVQRIKTISVNNKITNALNWTQASNASTREILYRLYTCVLHSFVDTVVFVLNDDFHVNEAVTVLSEWTNMLKQIGHVGRFRPSVVFMVPQEISQMTTILATTAVYRLKEQTDGGFQRIFSEPRAASEKSLSPQRQLSKNAYLQRTLSYTRDAKARTRSLLQARHIGCAISHFLKDFLISPMPLQSLVQACRPSPFPTAKLEDNLAHLLKVNAFYMEDLEFLYSYIASVFFLHAVSSEAHVFPAEDVFQSLFSSLCYRIGRIQLAAEEAETILLPSSFMAQVYRSFESYYNLYHQSVHRKAPAMHLKNLANLRNHWRRIKPQSTCLVCALEPVQYTLPCTHTLCSGCVAQCSTPDKQHRWKFQVRNCPLCAINFHPAFVIKLEDPCRSKRILSLDGGGMRGAIHPFLLGKIQEAIGLPMDIQEHFDIVAGTSCGALVALFMFAIGRSSHETLQAFENLGANIFSASKKPAILATISAFFGGTLCKTENLNAILQDHLSSEESFFSMLRPVGNGTNIIIPVTAARNGFPAAFSTHVGSPNDAPSHMTLDAREYGHLRVPPSKIAACAVAAPFFFSPHTIPLIGTFEDGALNDNNPTSIALEKVETRNRTNTWILNIGTGADKNYLAANAQPLRRWRDSTIIRMGRIFSQSLSGHRKVAIGRSLVIKENYHRMDITFDGREPGLHEYQCIPDLLKQAELQFSPSEIQIIADELVAQLFHFELTSAPRRVGGFIRGQGKILCDLPSNHVAYRPLLQKLRQRSSFFIVNNTTLNYDEFPYSKRGGYTRKISFCVTENKFKIQIAINRNQDPISINGSPFLLEERALAQGLEIRNGMKRPVNSTTKSSKRRKISFL